MLKMRRAVMALAMAAGTVAPGGAETTVTTTAPSEHKVSNLSATSAQAVFAASVTATGRIQATTSARIGPRVAGRLLEFGQGVDGSPLDVGAKVKKGDMLFKLEQATFQNSVALSQAQLASAKATLANLVAPTREERIEALKQDVAQLDARVTDRKREAERYKRLVEVEKTLPARRLEEVETDLASLVAQQKAAQARLQEAVRGPTPTEVAIADARVNEAQAALRIAQENMNNATVCAPFDGVITQRLKSVGDYLVDMPPTDVLELVSVDRLEAEVSLPESYMPLVRESETELKLKSPLLRNGLALKVARVVDHIDATTGVFRVRVTIPADRRDRLVPGAFITAELQMPSDAGGVIVPLRSVYAAEGRPFVYVAKDGKMMRQNVTLGDKLSEGIIATSGIRGGDKVIMGPADELLDGTALPEHLR